ncbi:hypothetical protein CsSME_00052761 [Camellia sinensis var. sinensis]
MVQLMNSGKTLPESESQSMKMVPVKLEVEDPLEDKHGPLNKRSKLSSHTPVCSLSLSIYIYIYTWLIANLSLFCEIGIGLVCFGGKCLSRGSFITSISDFDGKLIHLK